MPELPEVEHAARRLRRWMAGRTIARAEADATRVLRPGGSEAFARLAGHRVRGVERHGKVLLMELSGGLGLFAHLGMTGKFVLRPRGAPAPAHSRARLLVPGVGVVHFTDPRMFGRLLVAPLATLRASQHLRGLGPDALAGGAAPETLGPRLARTSRPVKSALMDQGVIAGLGNIQVTEALWRARLHPLRPASTLTPAEVERLGDAILGSLHDTLALEDDAEITYVEEPGAQNPFAIYGKAGERCPRCKAVIKKIDIAGRTSAYCPRCQRAPTRKPEPERSAAGHDPTR